MPSLPRVRETGGVALSPRIAAVVLTGGSGRRLGGADKAQLRLAGDTLLERALQATAAVDEVVVVGPRRPTSRAVTWAREDPPGGGPAAGVLAGVDALDVPADVVCVLAVDMPHVTGRTLDRLVAALGTSDADAACLASGVQRQWLAAAYRYAALADARPADPDAVSGLPMKRLVAPLRFVGVAAEADEAQDVDTWEDLSRLGGG